MRRVILAAATAVVAATLSIVPAGAWATYCDWDPLVLIVTPDGNVVPVYDSVWTASPLNIGLPVESYTATRGYDHGRPVTDVDVAITVPAGMLFAFSTDDMVSTGPLGTGTTLASKPGTSGSTTHLKFRLDVT